MCSRVPCYLATHGSAYIDNTNDVTMHTNVNSI